MTYTFVDISTTKFTINDRTYFKTYVAYLIDDDHIRIVSALDNKQRLIPVTNVSNIDIAGTSYSNATALINAIHGVLYAFGEAGNLDSQQIENNRLAIVGLESGKSDNGHTHDGRYYTESEIDQMLSGLGGGSEIDNGQVDGANLDLRDAGNNLLARINVSQLRSQATSVEYVGKTLRLKNENGETLSTATIEARQTYYDVARFISGIEDDLGDLLLTTDYALVKTTGGLYFFVSSANNDESLRGAKLYFNSNDEFYDLGGSDINGSGFIAWQLALVSDEFVVGNDYGFNVWFKKKNEMVRGWADAPTNTRWVEGVVMDPTFQWPSDIDSNKFFITNEKFRITV